MTKITTLLTAAAILAFLPACSTVVNGTNQTLAFNTGDVTGADCKLTGGSNFAVSESFTSPARVEIPRSKKSLELACSKAGYEPASKTVISQVEATTGGNILLGGFIGAGVDAATGALYKYPETISLAMRKLGMGAPASSTTTTTTTTEPTT